MKTPRVILSVFAPLFLSGAAFADTVVVSSVQSSPGTQSVSVTNTNGVATALVNGVPVTLPYNQNGTSIRVINGGQFISSLRFNALRFWHGNGHDRDIKASPLMPALSNP